MIGYLIPGLFSEVFSLLPAPILTWLAAILILLVFLGGRPSN